MLQTIGSKGSKHSKATGRAVIYARISRDRANEVSTEVQQRECKQEAKRRGLEVVDTFVDAGRSGWKPINRPAFERMKAVIGAGHADVVIAWKGDRIGRNMRALDEFDQFLELHGAGVVIVTEPLDTSTAGGELQRTMMRAFAQYESRVRSERVKGSMQQKAAKGQVHIGGFRVSGYKDDRVTIDRREAKFIRDGARRFLAGESLASIARDWNAKGFRTPADGTTRRMAGEKLTDEPTEVVVDGLWRPETVGRLYRTPHIAGLRRYDGGTVPGDWPAIIDPATWDRLCDRFADGTRRKSTSNGFAHLLSGIATCGTPMPTKEDPEAVCGAKLRHRGHGTGPRYVCEKLPGHDGCGRLAVLAYRADAEVENRLCAFIAEEVVANGMLNGASVDPRKLEREAAAIEQRRLELAEMYADGEISRAQLKAAQAKLDVRAQEIASELASAKASTMPKLPADPSKVRPWWSKLDLATKRAVLRAVTDLVAIDPATRRGAPWTGERVQISWAK
jgi:DNA invertase Pin-like site-specific DNA recombinase